LYKKKPIKETHKKRSIDIFDEQHVRAGQVLCNLYMLKITRKTCSYAKKPIKEAYERDL